MFAKIQHFSELQVPYRSFEMLLTPELSQVASSSPGTTLTGQGTPVSQGR